jgi:hypothetical protein
MTTSDMPADHAHDGIAAERFGRDVLGPIFAEFAQRLWMFQELLPGRERAALLFCARGGLRLRLIYEQFLQAIQSSGVVIHGDLMISRLVAARTLIDAPTDAVLDELGREFAARPMREVAAALAQESQASLGPDWDEPFGPKQFLGLLQGQDSETLRLRTTIKRLDQAFRRHLEIVSASRSTVVLCDTGLYGSTIRLLAEGVPGKRWVAAQFARSNYKGFVTPHFARTIGLSVERDNYTPWNARTAALRFWQLIEWVLEPSLASVRAFSDEPQPISNLEVPGWRDRLGPSSPGLFSGIMAYLSDLGPRDLPQIAILAERSWRQLHRSVVWPRPQDVSVLKLTARSRDFGRDEAVEQFAATSIRASLWREGALVQRFPLFGRGALAVLETVHSARAISRLVKRG